MFFSKIVFYVKKTILLKIIDYNLFLLIKHFQNYFRIKNYELPNFCIYIHIRYIWPIEIKIYGFVCTPPLTFLHQNYQIYIIFHQHKHKRN